ncbi:MAG: PfkB family carbohydrate kinase [Bdellovibrionota bacterium]
MTLLNSKKHSRVHCLGHITLDEFPQQHRHNIGGAAWFGAHVAHALKYPSFLWTRFDATQLNVFTPFVMKNFGDKKLTRFVHQFHQDKRELTCPEYASPLSIKTCRSSIGEKDLVFLGPVAQEIALSNLDDLPQVFVAAAGQGWFRKMLSDGTIVKCSPAWNTWKRTLDLCVVSHEDLHRNGDWDEICLRSRVAVQTKGSKGYLLSHQGKEICCKPALHIESSVDSTGAGDIFTMTMLLYMFEGMEPMHAAHLASEFAARTTQKTSIEEKLIYGMKSLVPGRNVSLGSN